MQGTNFIKDFKRCPYGANRVVKTTYGEETIRKQSACNLSMYGFRSSMAILIMTPLSITI